MPKISSGLLMYRIKNNQLGVFLVHPGGPFWKDKDDGAWSIPKGEVEDGEDFFECAKREFEEETGIKVKAEKFIELGDVKQKSGKIVYAWAFENEHWSGLLRQNIITIEFPYKSGRTIKIPEVDKAGFFNADDAKRKMSPSQFEFVEKLKKILKDN